MEILVVILVVALVAAVAYIVMQRRPEGLGRGARPAASPLGRRVRGPRRSHPLDDAVAEHARATEPGEVLAAEQRLQAEARTVAAGLNGGPAAGATAPVPGAPAAHAGPAGAVPPTDPELDRYFDPTTGERTDGYGDPANDPRYNDPKYDGRLAADWVDPREDDRLR